MAREQQYRLMNPGLESVKKVKKGRGHCIEGAGVFSGVEVGGGAWDNNKYFCVVVENRTAATLLLLIER